MKPKQEAPTKYPNMHSAPIKRLLKWITTTVSSTGAGVTYTQVKSVMDSTERKYASSYDVKEVLKNFVDNGRLQKVGYKYVLPQSPIKKLVVRKTADKKQVAKKTIDLKNAVMKTADKKQMIKKSTGMKEVSKKTTDKKHVVKNITGMKEAIKKTTDKKSPVNRLKQNIQNSPPVDEVKRSPRVFEVRDALMAEINNLKGIAWNEAIFSQSVDAEMPSQTTDAVVPSQTIDDAVPFQTIEADVHFQAFDTENPAEIFEAEESSKNSEIPAQIEEPIKIRGALPSFETEFNE